MIKLPPKYTTKGRKGLYVIIRKEGYFLVSRAVINALSADFGDYVLLDYVGSAIILRRASDSITDALELTKVGTSEHARINARKKSKSIREELKRHHGEILFEGELVGSIIILKHIEA